MVFKGDEMNEKDKSILRGILLELIFSKSGKEIKGGT